MYFIKYRTLSNKITQHKIKIWLKIINLWKKKKKKKFPKIQYSKFQEVSTSRPAPSVCKWNKIINFVLSVKLGEKMGFNAFIFYANRFLYNLQTKSKSKNFLHYSIHIFCLKHFLLKWIIKQFFGEVGDPLKNMSNLKGHMVNMATMENIIITNVLQGTDPKIVHCYCQLIWNSSLNQFIHQRLSWLIVEQKLSLINLCYLNDVLLKRKGDVTYTFVIIIILMYFYYVRNQGYRVDDNQLGRDY